MADFTPINKEKNQMIYSPYKSFERLERHLLNDKVFDLFKKCDDRLKSSIIECMEEILLEKANTICANNYLRKKMGLIN